jgi:hypothetical protein
MRRHLFVVLVACLVGSAARADQSAPPSAPDAGGARSAEEDAEIAANLELLEELPTLEDLDLVRTLAGDGSEGESPP